MLRLSACLTAPFGDTLSKKQLAKPIYSVLRSMNKINDCCHFKSVF